MPKKLTQNVNKDKYLNDLPKVHPIRSQWLSRHCNYQPSRLGEIVPIYYDEVLPGEKRKVTMAMTSHTQTPIAPIFNSLYTEFRAFFVPLRLCADLLNGYKTRKSPFVKVFGEDNANASSEIVVQLANQKLPDFTVNHRFIKDVSYYLDAADYVDNVFDSLDILDADNTEAGLKEFNFLNLAAYELIYQRHYRNENLESATTSKLYQLLFDAYNSSKSSVSLSSSFTFEIANREKDYFTGMKPFTQKGDAPTVNVGETALVKAFPQSAEGNLHDMGASVRLGYASGGTVTAYGTAKSIGTNSSGYVTNDTGSTSFTPNSNTASASNLYADLSTAKGLSIEELRLLIKTQELLEKDAMFGSRFAESLNAHFGTCPLDLTLNDPQELYKVTITSNMQAIFQTSSTSGESSILGTIGANSTTQTDPFVILPETEFKEYGIIMICAVHKLQNVYSSWHFKPKFNFKKARFDWYTPELNDLGFQPVSDKEFRNSTNSIVGYNEAFAEYRYKYNKSHGSFNNEFPYWAPAIDDDYTSLAAIYKEDPGILDKGLSVYSTTAPQFYDAFGFEEYNDKPMSLHSIPGFDGVI